MKALSREERLILADILGVSPDYIFFHQNELNLSQEALNQLNTRMNQLKNGKPLSKIIHKKPFWNHEFYVTDDTLDPRQDSEVIIEAVLDNVSKNEPLKILDIGTGTGCLIISLLDELPNAEGVGTDISEKALAVAEYNAKKIINFRKIRLTYSNFCDKLEGVFDVIVSNPPYIRTADIPTLSEAVRLYDPILALDGGDDGLEAYRKIAEVTKRLLKEDGILVVEVGYDQMQEVCGIFRAHGFSIRSVYKDTLGIDRVAVIDRRVL